MPKSFIVDGGILAGGRASRMQGKDKGLQVFKQKPMAEWVCQAISPAVRKVVINCNRNHAAYTKLSQHICHDTIADFPGPLAGIISIIEASDADYFLISPCDTPLLSKAFASIMFEALTAKLTKSANISNPTKLSNSANTTNHANNTLPSVLFAVDTKEKQHPLHLCISRDYVESLKHFIHEGEHRVMQWMTQNQAEWLDFSEHAEMFRNFNTLEEVSAD